MRKKLLFVLLFAFAVSLNAQNSTLPDAVSKAFEQKFPKAKKVKWESENIDDYSASFALDSLNCTAVFSPKGNWQQTGIDIPLTKLLPAIHADLKKNYPKAKITRATKIETAKQQVYYEVELKKSETIEYIYYDLNGVEILSMK
ncbi:MAG: PepSY-like domain-containing protein [Bacteroidia bacterium]